MKTVETTTSSTNSTNAVLPAAYLCLKKYVQKYLKENFDKLSEKYGITKNDLLDLRKDKNSILEWVLGECLDDNEFKELGIVVKSDLGIEDENTHTTIYKIGRKFVKSSFKDGEYMVNHNFDFVKPVKKKITVYSYDPVSQVAGNVTRVGDSAANRKLNVQHHLKRHFANPMLALGFKNFRVAFENEIMTEQEIQKHFDIANDLAVKEVERLAREVLRNNPKELLKFTMAMGSYFFSDNKDEIIHTVVGENEAFLQGLEGYNELVEFIAKWDEYFGLTGTPMTFTAEGEMITDW